MNILVTVDANYLHPLTVMLYSLSCQHPGTEIHVYLAHSSLSSKELAQLRKTVETENLTLFPIRLSDEQLENAPVTRRYPREMYYRIFAAQYLPEQLDRILYLDPDIVVINPLDELYHMDFEGNLFAAATHIRAAMRKLNEIRLAFPENGPYINSGVILMNLALLRKVQDMQQVFDYIEKYRYRLFLPDQDIISSLYGNQILLIDAKRFNMTERVYLLSQTSAKSEKRLTLEEIRAHSAIVHYCGKNKPWRKNYHGRLHVFYQEYASRLKGPDRLPARERLLLMVNPHAGKGTLQNQFLSLVDLLVKGGYDVTVRTTQRTGELPEIIRTNADDYDLLVACGGDGTLNEAVTGILRHSPDSLFGYIPAGTVNDFAFSLRLPRNNILEAAGVVVNGSVFDCDIGTFDHRYFTYVAAFGAFTDVSYSTPQDFKNLFGKAAYFLQGMSRLTSLKSYHVRFVT
ncbi:MAG: glycosyltransferase, partial [Oscillospiraceae bacterium]|nr:glycosyltransferase [Oscillospiraceae bacterium]